jgi:ATP-binding cassette subfamily F protein 3
MLIVNRVSKLYGAKIILDGVSFVVNPGDRVALLGPNGCGKSTLLDIIAGDERPDGGEIALDAAARLGYLRQGIEPPSGRTVAAQVRAGIPGWEDARREVDGLAARMAGAEGAALDRLMAQYDAALTRFETLGGYGVDHRIDSILARLGLGTVDPTTPVERLSGGEGSRARLAGVLIAEPTLLLLDEPTNHLDIDALEWLEEFLAAYPGAVLIVSHDRVFLDRTVNRVLDLDDKTHRIAEYEGSYTAFAEQKARAADKQMAAWRDQRAEIRRVKRDIQQTSQQALRVEDTTKNDQIRRYAKKVAKKAQSRKRKLERYLESEERVEKPEQRWHMKLEFGEMPRGGQEVVVLDGLGHAYADRWLFRDVDRTLLHGERIALLGPNGSGKSTLLRIIAGQIAPAEGSVKIGASVRLGYMPQKQETLDPAATPLSVILRAAPMSETDARNFLHYFLFAGDEVFTPAGSLSYGERARLLLARLVVGGANCLILDEPVNHLDIPSRQRFEDALDAFPGTVLVAVHDRAFIDRFATGIWALEERTVQRYPDRLAMRRTHTDGR